MKSQRIPEHKLNFTGEVGQAIENTTNIETHNTNLKGEVGAKNNPKKDI